ncbi:C4-dicarboxylate ABC transporter substrate-binding protein [Methylobacterium sp. Leaf104]|uniref:TAXI family TRAP transporter solute-binding subunit n=1 Tax=Methylobacterium TaxID=407 RepID=UPI0006F21513|nr:MULTISPECIES: TAXI family TRAP transporter solute-binding subunit [Methylobacterium]KQP38387.1 C4-dicarboxylate ABC transporter substrate-binding protein [Methylobacterium sp. Leaf104]MCI9880207.1 TAXI family TRAP transporter solute-binding subunit [Methylobacterium goesingense]
MLRRSFLVGVTAATLIVPGRARSAGAPGGLVLATATPGGSFPAFGQALVEALGAADPTLSITLRPSKGSAENVGLLKGGTVDLALVQGDYATDALRAEPAAGARLTVVAPVNASPGLFVVPAASGIRGVPDLRGRRVVLGTHASGLTVMGRTVLAGSGIDPDRDIEPILLDRAGDGAVMVQDGRAAALWGAGLGWPGFRTLAEAPGGARFFGPAPDAIDRILALGTSLRRRTVPANALKGQQAPIDTVGSWSFVLARPDVDGALVARFVAALAGSQARLAQSYPQGGDSDPRNLVDAVPHGWLHPASAAYLRGIGALP